MTYHLIKEFLDFLGIISWPLTALIIFYFLKTPMSEILRNIKKFSYGGAEILTNQQKLNNAEIDLSSELTGNSNIEKILKMFSNTSNTFAAQVLENETKIDEITNPQTKINLLENYSKLLIIIKTAEKIYSSIYGSQIRILQRLNHSKSEKTEDLKFYFNNAKKVYPKVYNDYSYENYLHFLVNYSLIQINDDIATITDVGRDFLRYIIESNLSFEKLY